ncbi:hypothetical protein EIP91_011870 [Steccherinum ochraceum]|uniref:LysM domain-containing protein n=1 Tax=Steccherinum ochraceum TaxID=92696 RepID=A0A4R0RL48_9APHY|nr:hypothetical protein EIP91_011870 [Steccherinum ochraceum]
MRSRTVDSAAASSSRTNHHPLARHGRGSKSSGSIVSLNDTRPRLKRLLSDLGTVSVGEDSKKNSDTEQSPRDELHSQRVVIVHEVTPTDSLAGVALKYGVTLADLRRANQMWTSDTIHLRKALYIPIEKTQKSKQFNLALIDLDAAPTPSLSDAEPTASTVSLDGISDQSGDGHPSVTVRRVPASHLSYFPPPPRASTTLSSSPTFPRSYSDQPSSQGLGLDIFSPEFYASHPSERAGAPLRPSANNPLRSHITSLFSALPIAPFTRDTLISRLSLDSSSSTPTQGSEEHEHELDDVGSSSLRPFHLRDSFSSPQRVFSEGRVSAPDTSPVDNLNRSFELRPMSPPRTPTPHHKHLSSTEVSVDNRTSPHKGPPPALYTSPERSKDGPNVVRTAQLQPSSGMQLPPRRSGSKDGNT